MTADAPALTADDVAQLKATWAAVRTHGDLLPLVFYEVLFKIAPEASSMFPLDMAAQRDRIVAAIGTSVARVDQLDKDAPRLRALGRDHRKYGTLTEHYDPVIEAFLITAGHFAGPAMTPDLAALWRTALRAVCDEMIAGAAAAEAAGEPPWWNATIDAVERTDDHGSLVLYLRVPGGYPAERGTRLTYSWRHRQGGWLNGRAVAVYDGPVLEVPVHDGSARDRRDPVAAAVVVHAQAGDPVRLGPPKTPLDTQEARP